MRTRETAIDSRLGDEHVVLRGGQEQGEAVVPVRKRPDVGAGARRLVPGLVVQHPGPLEGSQIEGGEVAAERAHTRQVRQRISHGQAVLRETNLDAPVQPGVFVAKDDCELGVFGAPWSDRFAGARRPCLVDDSLRVRSDGRTRAQLAIADTHPQVESVDHDPPEARECCRHPVRRNAQ